MLASACLAAAAASLSTAQPAPTPRTTPADTSRKPVPVETAASNTPTTDDETIVLSPFEVVSETRGYYAPNTMSGTRFNTKLEDLASAISVVTKEQMQDFAMLDINDVFLYSANTEGSGTYTDYTVDRNGQLMDNVQLNPTQANRIRGIAAANISYGNFETNGRTPLDPLILDGVEISRGPNANVFGLGNPSGTVNQVPSAANLTRDRSKLELRADSYDGYRVSLDVNRVLIKNKLAVRASVLNQREGFERKPSGITTKRYNAMIKYQPFKYTTISASYLDYRSYGNRPNFTPPRDNVSYWVQSGRPGWDPVTQSVHVNGQTLGPFTTDTAVPNYFSRAGAGGANSRGNIFIDQTGLAYWTAPVNNTGVSPNANTGAGANFLRLMFPSPGPNASLGRFTDQPLFTTTPSVVDKAMYDWSSINLAAPNYVQDTSKTTMVTLDQLFINTPLQTLAAQAGFFREDSTRFRRTPIGDAGISGQTGQLWVDVNERNLDGTVNPFFGRTFIGVSEPITRQQPAKWDTSRAQLAYRINFGEMKGWTHWLGEHQLSGYYEYKYRINRSYGYRDVLTSDHPWTVPGIGGAALNYGRGVQSNVTGGPQAGPNVIRGFFRYYVGDNTGNNVDYAPGDFQNGKYTFVWGTTGNWKYENATLGQVATTDSTGGNNNLKQVLKTEGAVIQSRFINNSIVTTFGVRKDKVYSKNGFSPVQLAASNTAFDYNFVDAWAPGDYRYSTGDTKTGGVVVRPFRDLSFAKQLQSGTGISRFFGEIVRGLSITYNKSDSFIPAPPAVDLFLNPLPNTTAIGKDYGFALNMYDGKFVLRVNHYKVTQFNFRDGDANTVAQRVLRLDLDISADNYQLYDRATDWFSLTNPTWTPDVVRTEVLKQMEIKPETYDALVTNFRAGTIAATNDLVSKGTEIELNYNPTKYWTLAASVTEGQAINQNVSTAVQKWIDQRMRVWTTIVDQNTNPALGTGASQGWVATPDNPGHLWWLHSYQGSQTPQQNFLSFVNAPYQVIHQTEGKSRPQVRRYNARVSTNYKLAGLTDHKIVKNFSVGGAVRWEDRGAIGYYGVQQYPAVITELDPNNPIWDKGHYYFDAFVTYRTRLFADRVGATFQFNVRNIQEGGRLQAIGAFPNGVPNSYRIVDPRQFVLTATFDL